MPKIIKNKKPLASKFILVNKLSKQHQNELVKTLKSRYLENMNRHEGIDWSNIQAKLEKNPQKLVSLNAMDQTGGEPDVIDYDKKTGEYIFYDCCEQSPEGRRSLCYDRQALESRKQHKPVDSALDMAKEMGIELLSEAEYRQLQELGVFDTTTSSWVQTPKEIRKHGGAIFCDRRYDHVFLYHNGADSYYASRGFRGLLRV